MLRTYRYPSPALLATLLQRPAHDVSALRSSVAPILAAVRAEGDAALRRYCRTFDHAAIDELRVSAAAVAASAALVSADLKSALAVAKENIATFHRAQRRPSLHCPIAAGVDLWQKTVPLDSVGLYVPGGTAPLVSTVLMLAVPAAIAGVKEIVLCTPPREDGSVAPAILYAAHLAGVRDIFRVGGAQAIAAMAYGTATIPRVAKICGPGNQYVTCAKQLVALDGTAIDLPAGPTEVMILADGSADATFVAADLLSQAEHGRDSQVLLCTTSEALIPAVLAAVAEQLPRLPRRDIAAAALENSAIILLKDSAALCSCANAYAPEHLIIATADYAAIAKEITTAGSVFLGPYTPESAGDYATGTNHTLPTAGYARAYSGVTLATFCRTLSFQRLTADGIASLAPAVETLAAAEGLEGHRQAMVLRRTALANQQK